MFYKVVQSQLTMYDKFIDFSNNYLKLIQTAICDWMTTLIDIKLYVYKHFMFFPRKDSISITFPFKS